jgi:UrcA family protein
MVDRLLVANAALLAATTMLVALAGLHGGAAGRPTAPRPAPHAAARATAAVVAAIGPEVSIRLDDVDLNRPADALALARRIRRGAETLCGAARFSDPRQTHACVQETTDKAVAELSNPQVAAANAAAATLRP